MLTPFTPSCYRCPERKAIVRVPPRYCEAERSILKRSAPRSGRECRRNDMSESTGGGPPRVPTRAAGEHRAHAGHPPEADRVRRPADVPDHLLPRLRPAEGHAREQVLDPGLRRAEGHRRPQGQVRRAQRRRPAGRHGRPGRPAARHARAEGRHRRGPGHGRQGRVGNRRDRAVRGRQPAVLAPIPASATPRCSSRRTASSSTARRSSSSRTR